MITLKNTITACVLVCLGSSLRREGQKDRRERSVRLKARMLTHH